MFGSFKKTKKSKKLIYVLFVVIVSFILSLGEAKSRVLVPNYDNEPVADYIMDETFYDNKYISNNQKDQIAKDSYLEQIQGLDFYAVNNDDTFLKFLGIYYKSYAFYLHNYLANNQEAEHFAKKALIAYKGEVPVIDNLNTRRISVSQAVDLSLSVDRYREAFGVDAHSKLPLEMAYAQVNLDCWLERQSNNSDFHQMASCQNTFLEKMDKVFEEFDFNGKCITCGKMVVAKSGQAHLKSKSVKETTVVIEKTVEKRELPKIPVWNGNVNAGAKKYYGDSPELIEYKRLVKEMVEVQKGILDAEGMNTKRMAILQEELMVLKELIKQSKKSCRGAACPNLDCGDKDCPDVSLDELKKEISDLKDVVNKKSVPVKVIDEDYKKAVEKKVEQEKAGETVVMNFPAEVFFDWDMAVLKEQYKFIIEDAGAYILDEGIDSIVVEGHADASGPNWYNEELSQKRADAIKNALVTSGVSGNIIKTVAKGEEDLKVQTEDGIVNPENRRGVIIID